MHDIMTTETELVSCLHSALMLIKTSTEGWIEGSFNLAVGLAEAKRRIPGNRDFSIWLMDNELEEINYHDRAALINMGQHPKLLRIVLQETESKSYRLIWEDDMRYRIDARSGSAVNSTRPEESERRIHLGSAAKMNPLEKNKVNPVNTPAKDMDEPSEETTLTKQQEREENPDRPKGVQLNKKSALNKYRKANEIMQLFTANTRTMFTKVAEKKGFGETWNMILMAYNNGLLAPAPNDELWSMTNLTLRALFPAGPMAFCRGYNLENPTTRANVRDRILPIMVHEKDKLIANPNSLEEIIRGGFAAVQEERRKKMEAGRLAKALEKMSRDEEPVVMYGEPFWPDIGRTVPYNYYQLCCAVWTFDSMVNSFKGDPASIVIQIRHSIKWWGAYANLQLDDANAAKMKTVNRVIHAICDDYAKNPNGQCKKPSFPHGGGWEA
jgi:hypothetical protein